MAVDLFVNTADGPGLCWLLHAGWSHVCRWRVVRRDAHRCWEVRPRIGRHDVGARWKREQESMTTGDCPRGNSPVVLVNGDDNRHPCWFFCAGFAQIGGTNGMASRRSARTARNHSDTGERRNSK